MSRISRDGKKLEDYDYTPAQYKFILIFGLVIGVVCVVLGFSFNWTWPPLIISLAKAFGALFAALSALAGVFKDKQRDKLDALKNCEGTSPSEVTNCYNWIKRCRIAEMCLLVLVFVAASVAI